MLFFPFFFPWVTGWSWFRNAVPHLLCFVQFQILYDAKTWQLVSGTGTNWIILGAWFDAADEVLHCKDKERMDEIRKLKLLLSSTLTEDGSLSSTLMFGLTVCKLWKLFAEGPRLQALQSPVEPVHSTAANSNRGNAPTVVQPCNWIPTFRP
jgi:hypothetical protein